MHDRLGVSLPDHYKAATRIIVNFAHAHNLASRLWYFDVRAFSARITFFREINEALTPALG
jgi:hypothetical protein